MSQGRIGAMVTTGGERDVSTRAAGGRVRLGSVWGIPIGLHPTWFFVFALVTWSLAAGYFPHEHPGWPVLQYWLVGAATALLFFCCILVHELGHSRVSIQSGIAIRGITLFIFGGVAQIAREPASPRVELKIAVAGPLTSLALAAGFAGAWLVVRGAAVLEAPAIWLARINLMVAIFNLIPGFPLDGGRVFRALVWLWTGNFAQATWAASLAGQVFAVGFIGLGVLTALGGNALGGVWMILIGWFLQSAAAAIQAQAGLVELLRGATVTQAMDPDCPRVPRTITLARLVHDEVLGRGRRCFFVTEDGHLHGLLTLHELKTVPRERWERVTAAEVMTPTERLVTVTPEQDLFAALQKMDDARVSQMPVVAGGRLLGTVSREQVLHYVRVRAELGT